MNQNIESTQTDVSHDQKKQQVKKWAIYGSVGLISILILAVFANG
jgi:uncharacterized protein YfaS (alpha-2-macroglobulin family)